MKMNKKGFTLIELLVVVLIIGILAAIALPQYFKAVEKSKSAEALVLFGSIVGAEQRYFLTHDAYTTDFNQLDVDFPNASGNTMSTNNYTITLSGTGADDGTVTATRNDGTRYPHTLTRGYESSVITCSDTAADPICSSLGSFNNTQQG